LTRHGHVVARLAPVPTLIDRKSRGALLEAARAGGMVKATAGQGAARSQDFLYRDDGLPE
jgi:antitoxin (DNA-binding transcriptional repressor) of toxin-antitoxin stability system